MSIKRQAFFTILTVLNLMMVMDSFATKIPNPFQNTWSSNDGTVTITQCQGMKCKIKIDTMIGAFTCDLEGVLFVLSDKEALFQIKKVDNDQNKLFPIRVSLSKQSITVTIPKGSHEAARGYCGNRVGFEGEYFAHNTKRIYATSFNCDNAKTKIELALCHSEELAYADRVLSKLYFQIKTKKFDYLIIQQKTWIKERNLCSKSVDLNQCLLGKYRERILTLQQNFISTHPFEKMNPSLPYNFEYFIYLVKNTEIEDYDIFSDPPLQSYLNAALVKDVMDDIFQNRFSEINIKSYNDSLIMITGAAPGLYKICEGALILTKEHETWLAYTTFDSSSKKQIVIICPKNIDVTTIPTPLKQWADKLLPYMDNKDIIYKKLFTSNTLLPPALLK